MLYDPFNWFWTVGGDTSRAWSTAKADYVQSADPAFESFISAGNAPASISSEASLYDVLAAQYPAGAGALGTVAQRAAALIEESTVDVTSTSAPALSGTYGVNAVATTNITAIQTAISAGVGLPGGGTTVAYVDAGGADHFFTAPQFTAFAATLANYVYALTRCAHGKSATLPSANLTIP